MNVINIIFKVFVTVPCLVLSSGVRNFAAGCVLPPSIEPLVLTGWCTH